VETRDLLNRTAAHAADSLESLDERAIAQPVDVDELRSRLGGPIETTDADVERAVGAILQAVEDSRAAAVRG
jgi:predicted thioredoxin/glutaredoxin